MAPESKDAPPLHGDAANHQRLHHQNRLDACMRQHGPALGRECKPGHAGNSRRGENPQPRGPWQVETESDLQAEEIGKQAADRQQPLFQEATASPEAPFDQEGATDAFMEPRIPGSR